MTISAIILGLGFGLGFGNKEETTTVENVGFSDESVTITNAVPVKEPSETASRKNEDFTSISGTYSQAAVASDGKPCAKIGV